MPLFWLHEVGFQRQLLVFSAQKLPIYYSPNFKVKVLKMFTFIEEPKEILKSLPYILNNFNKKISN